MVVVRCLILCSKFTKNRLSARTRWGAYSASSDPLAGSLGRERKGEMEGQEGEGKGEEGYPLRIKIMATALLLIISTLLGWIVTPRLVIFGVPPHGAGAKIQNSASEKFCSQTHRI